ncbi:MAG: hypothetical protein IT495_02850 [Gammaproteobacteria bacterium]|nr:hypothetical protein [Gammaproteobacteria bacterium]
MSSNRVVIVTGDPAVAAAVCAHVEALGYGVAAVVGTSREAIYAAIDYAPFAVLIDRELRGDLQAEELLSALRQVLQVEGLMIETAAADGLPHRPRGSRFALPVLRLHGDRAPFDAALHRLAAAGQPQSPSAREHHD